MTDKDKSLGLPTKEQSRSLEGVRQALQPWLRERLNSETLEIVNIEVPTGSGLANETILLDLKLREQSKFFETGFVVRIEAAEPLFPGTTAKLQYQMNHALEKVKGVPTPKVFAYESDVALLGAPFYLMERIDGRVSTDNPPFHHAGWVVDEVDEAERTSMFHDAVKMMAKFHQVNVEGFEFLNPNGFTDGLRAHFDYYLNEFDLPANESHRVIDAGRSWLLANFPKRQGLSLAWGDARVGNMIFKEGKCKAILDWDMVSLAGAETDLAWWCSFDQSYTASAGIKRLAGIGTPAEMIALWEEYSGRKVENFDWHLAFAFYKAAVIVRRLAGMLKRKNLLPPESEHMVFNNAGVQYLASFLKLKSDYPVDKPWPGLMI